MTRGELKTAGFIAMHAANDLAGYGWQIRYWFNPRTKQVAIEYIPRAKGKLARKQGDEGAVIVTTYEEQAAFHRSIGAAVTPPGVPWVDCGKGHEQGFLF